MAENVVKIRPALTALKIGESITFPHFQVEKRSYPSLRVGSHLQPAVQDPNQQGEHEYHRKTY